MVKNIFKTGDSPTAESVTQKWIELIGRMERSRA